MIDLRECRADQLMPEVLRKDAGVQAASWALYKTAGKILEMIDKTSVYAAVDILPEPIVNLLAEELRAQYYDTGMALQEKREAVKRAMKWHEKAGTLGTVKELTEIVWGENVISEWYEHDGRPYTFWLEVMGLDRLITDQGMADFMAALQMVKNTRSLLDRIIFHRRVDIEVHSGAAVASYIRQVIVDFYSEEQKDNIDMHSGMQHRHYHRQAVVEHFKSRSTTRQEILSGGVPALVLKQTIKEG